jgi:hypothetical protein
MSPLPIAALLPTNPGYQFVVYADACSGVPGALHERTFAAVNAVVQRLDPQPEFICFPGDEISGLTADADALRAQWHYWFDHEMAWLDRSRIPLYHTTANHTTYDPASEDIFREVMAHLPRNGPPGQEGLSYAIRRRPVGATTGDDDLLMLFVNTLWSGLGGEGYVELDWLEQTLTEHADARYKIVFGHHPVFPINGFVGSHQREIAHEIGPQFWKILVRHGVLAYWCSHILAFDVQVHEGVLQILTAGAGTAHRMPEEIEYLHAMQAALDRDGLRYQVLDVEGRVREWLRWPLIEPEPARWRVLAGGVQPAPRQEAMTPTPAQTPIDFWQISGVTSADNDGTPQTLVSLWDETGALAPLWIGLHGRERRLAILLAPQPGRSPHLWTGPTLPPNQPFTLQLALHSGMGPGGLLWREDATQPWSSLRGASAWGVERLPWPPRCSIGHAQRGEHDRPFRGRNLAVTRQTNG